MNQPIGLLQFPLLLEVIFHPRHCDLQHFIHVKAVGLRWRAGFIIESPIVRK